MFVAPQTPVYQGMIVGEHSRNNDLEINVLKGKQLTNVRASGSDEAVKLVPPRRMSLEEMMAYINEDELLEVTLEVCAYAKCIFVRMSVRKPRGIIFFTFYYLAISVAPPWAPDHLIGSLKNFRPR